MMFHSAGETTAVVVTLVLRVWRAGPSHESAGDVRYETRHVQTGEVAYFRSLEGVTQHVRCLVDQFSADALAPRPIQFPQRPAIDPAATE